MQVGLELHLQHRGEDRVIVGLVFEPIGVDEVLIEGAAVQLVDRDGEEICPRAIVPISGSLRGPLASQVELRTSGKLPRGCRVVATAWAGAETVEQFCPADPYVCLGTYVCGAATHSPDTSEVVLEVPDPVQRERLEKRWPWLAEVRPTENAGVIEVDEGPSVDDIQANFGLGDEEAAWLRDLMGEDL
jgi:hypothetical protein